MPSGYSVFSNRDPEPLTVGPWSSWTRSGSSVDGGDGSDVMGFEALRPGRSEQKPRMHCEVAGGVAGKGR